MPCIHPLHLAKPFPKIVLFGFALSAFFSIKACYPAFADEPPREENPLCGAAHNCVDECVSIETGEYSIPARETLIVIAKCAKKCEVLLHCPDFSFPRKE